MIFWAIALLLIGVFLSAFFSGSETGFYRASRVRVVTDALDGDRVSQFMMKLINNPTLFVATTLVGNNVANYMVSLAIVLATRSLYLGDNGAAEMVAPILMSPFLFVYGELMPKKLFYMAPNRLLRLGAPLFLFFTVVFAPVSAVLWGLARLLEKMLGQSPDRIRLALAKKEVQQVLEEGLAAGILHPSQQQLAQNFFALAEKKVAEIYTPLSRFTTVESSKSRDELLKIARRKKLPDVPIWKGRRNQLIGYVRTLDLLIGEESETTLPIRDFSSVTLDELAGEALLQMQANRQTLVKVVNRGGNTVGFMTIDQLTNPLLDGPLDSLRR